ncbi:MAG: hypothetical protein M3371_00740 [Acidobacteriota bacterium]|nr:hypothetical protein [Acidobacteriota bacterium]
MSQVKPALAQSSFPIQLRELGIYKLKDGREYIVSTLYQDGCCLYSTQSWQMFGNAEFWVRPDGQLIHDGRPTRWGVKDLIDTGLTSKYPKASNFIV